MRYEWDEQKRRDNLTKHGVDFIDTVDFWWDSALISPDTRANYSETRFKALGIIGNRLHCLVYTVRGGAIRIISLRKANKRERGKYEKAIS